MVIIQGEIPPMYYRAPIFKLILKFVRGTSSVYFVPLSAQKTKNITKLKLHLEKALRIIKNLSLPK